MQSVDIILSYPWWSLALSFVVAVGLSYLLYTRNYFDNEDSRPLRIGLASLRTLFLTLLFFLILGPLLKSNEQELEKPSLVIALDNSASVVLKADSSKAKELYNRILESAQSALGDAVEIQTLQFGDAVAEGDDVSFSDKASNISKVLQTIDDQYENRNLGGIVLVTDGIFNQGPNPEYLNRRVHAPIHTIGLGDTTMQRDLILEVVRHNDIAFLGNEYPLELVIKGQKLKAGKTILRVRSDKETLFEETLELEEGTFSFRKQVMLQAKTIGIQDLSISLQAVEDESSILNNSKRVFIEVLDGRNKVLLYAKSPHPDVSAIKQAIESNKNYEVKVVYAFEEKRPALQDVDLLILHRLPQYEHPITDLLESASNQNLPLLFVVDESVYAQALMRAVPEFNYQARRGDINESLPHWNDDFSLFELSESSMKILHDMPPIQSPYARYQELANNRVLAYQQIGAIATKQPLIAFSQNNEFKSGIIYGTGLWRWRLYEYDETEAHQATNELINRCIQFLSVRENKSPFRVKTVQRTFNENEAVRFEAQLYNKAFQLIVEPDVKLNIRDESGKTYSYTMGRNFKQYSLDAGYLKPGSYTYEASCSYSGQALKAKGSFLVKPLQLENLNTTARHDMLRRLSDKSSGIFVEQSNADQLFASLKSNHVFKSISYYRSSFLDFIDLRWFFWILLAFISCEWIIRKSKGGY